MKMKKRTFAMALLCIVIPCIVHKASCQSITNHASLNIETLLPENTDRDIYAIHIRAVRKFVRNFKDAQNVTWDKSTDGGYVARFTNDSIRTMVAYNSNGSWSYTLKKYAENKMSTDLRDMVKSTYFDYAIAEVTEIDAPQERGALIYTILIKHADNFKILSICDGQMEITRDDTKP